MGEALRQALPIGLAVALSPFPIIGIVVILAAPGGLARALAFLCGSLVGISVVGAIVLSLESRADPVDDGDPAIWVSLLKLALAAGLVALALDKWRGRPRPGRPAAAPAWMTAAESLSVPGAALLGVLLSAVNPKNLILTIAAATSIGGATDDTRARVVALGAFVLVACAGVGLPILASALLGGRASHGLETAREWMLRNNAVITMVIAVAIAVTLAIDAIDALAG